MATLLVTLGGAVLNATAFIGGNYLAKYLSGDNADEERKRHDVAIEKLQKSRDEWNRKRQKYQDYLYKQSLKKNKAELDFSNTDIALEKYMSVSEPVLSDYYQPSEEQKQGEILYIILGGAAILFFIKKINK